MTAWLAAPYFGADAIWARLARVLAWTAHHHCPDWQIAVQAVMPRQFSVAEVHRRANPSHVHNTQKMQAWHDVVMRAPDGTRVLLIDADTMILRPIDDVWNHEFDFAHTTKPSRFPFNSGVVFLRVSPPVREFITWWRDENVRMLSPYGETHHLEWRNRYGGINQASLGHALKCNLTNGLRIREFPCAEWNCEDSSWPTFNEATTRIVHVKSGLRRAVLGQPLHSVFGAKPSPNIRRLVEIWRTYDRQSAGVAA